MIYIGWIGSILLATCGLPQVIQTIRTKSVKGVNALFLLMWFLGEVGTLIFIFPKTDLIPLLFNYCLNTIFVFILLFYKTKESFK